MFRRLRRVLYNLSHPVIGEVWQLHHVSDEDYGIYGITPSRLEQLILDYRAKGYEFIPISDILKPRKHKFVAVTLDDGYEDNFLNGMPLFDRLNIPYCIFVVADYVFDSERRECKRGMTPSQLDKIAKDPLCTIGGHTKTHCHLAELDTEAQRNEIAWSKGILEEFVEKPLDCFAYPYGDYEERTLGIVREAGFRYAFAAWGGGVRKGWKKELEIPRIIK